MPHAATVARHSAASRGFGGRARPQAQRQRLRPPLVRRRCTAANFAAQRPNDAEKTYYTHANGGRPYKVVVAAHNASVTVFPWRNAATADNEGRRLRWKDRYEAEPVLHLDTPSKVWVGKSPRIPMTEFSGGHGVAFGGNSFLIEGGGVGSEDREVYFVQSSICSFRPAAPIVFFLSPVGNNDVPYPYAIDLHGTTYLLIEGATLRSPPANITVPPENGDPYDEYYARCMITEDAGYVPPRPARPEGRQAGIRAFFMRDGGEEEEPSQYTLVWRPPESTTPAEAAHRRNGMFVIREGETQKRPFSQDEYDALMRAHAERAGLGSLQLRWLS